MRSVFFSPRACSSSWSNDASVLTVCIKRMAWSNVSARRASSASCCVSRAGSRVSRCGAGPGSVAAPRLCR